MDNLIFACLRKDYEIKVFDRKRKTIVKTIKMNDYPSQILRESTLFTNILFIKTTNGILMVDIKTFEVLTLLE